MRTIRTIAGGRELYEVGFHDAGTAVGTAVGAVDGGWRVEMGTLGNELIGATVLLCQADPRPDARDLITQLRLPKGP